ncbi:acetyl-CoA C-acetyltransferase [Bdellovibrio svalbardensis]|uniref:Acetyl-CoA C-acetyltransferase n=1 Tax=Bdellovibrio svalbardensis TaxID=2972972 RepID=A0ABT6DIW4_9BACT|nr:acetyl-CoA C-acetyltransferase [Bdellovibrio svalbardensis]MDG0816802.1 acetyl-CoA C-acetyltransferase [Bdellovibrio svalbardensis]
MKTKQMRPVAILAGSRTPFTKSFTNYNRISNQTMMTATIRDLVWKTNLVGKRLGDVSTGAVMKNASDWNMTRESVLGAGLNPHTPGYDVQRACGTGLETAWQIGLKIASGAIESGIAGGTDTNSDIAGVLPHEFSWIMMDAQKEKTLLGRIKKFAEIKPKYLMPQFPAVMEPRTGLSMGQHTEKMVKEWGITQLEQDKLALQSHLNADRAWKDGFFNDLVFEFNGLKKDSLVRGDTSLEKLTKLKPAFDFTGQGTLTAGNSTALTDGASAVLLGSEEFAKQQNLPVLAYLVDAEVAAVDYVAGEGLLMAPTYAIARMLRRNNLTLQDFDFYEIHEAFAGQVLCTLKALESEDYCKNKLGEPKALGSIDRAKMNVNGGSLALGHPFAATGGRILISLAKMLSQKGSGRGLISICTAGGMGVTAIVER